MIGSSLRDELILPWKCNMRMVPEKIFMVPESLTSVAVPFEIGGRTGFRFGCKIG